ncbi:hypothetical protein [Thermovenabulum gondwanense]|uniref:DUF2281 domain-containing protein n=1 Tax=Thermovenabulum gondwanense TaxID=520767 RepID=A0A161PUE9_9FIRM|nr:hypothetical protein [Thermovenabulum gondwanense]KYO66124.1 hypothetical protein ATZ99_13160 [Thermovenabulum gondwanense]
MNFIKTVINSNKLSGIIDIPNELKNKVVEVIILPLADAPENKNIRKLKGALKKYKNPELINLEKEAWQKAVEEKHEHS